MLKILKKFWHSNMLNFLSEVDQLARKIHSESLYYIIFSTNNAHEVPLKAHCNFYIGTQNCKISCISPEVDKF